MVKEWLRVGLYMIKTEETNSGKEHVVNFHCGYESLNIRMTQSELEVWLHRYSCAPLRKIWVS